MVAVFTDLLTQKSTPLSTGNKVYMFLIMYRKDKSSYFGKNGKDDMIDTPMK